MSELWFENDGNTPNIDPNVGIVCEMSFDGALWPGTLNTIMFWKAGPNVPLRWRYMVPEEVAFYNEYQQKKSALEIEYTAWRRGLK